MRIKIFYFLLFVSLLGCNPYKGFKGVDDKGMSNGKLPSQEVKSGYEKSIKKQKRAYKREMKKRAKRLGTTKKK